MGKQEYLNHILEIFEQYGDFSSRSMFGGYGLYKNKVIFAIIADDELYFKVDDSNQQQYIDYHCEPFSYEKNGKSYKMSYWKLPVEILEDEELLALWIDQSYQISLKKKK
jgi:DNA transformation protein and related proteins